VEARADFGLHFEHATHAVVEVLQGDGDFITNGQVADRGGRRRLQRLTQPRDGVEDAALFLKLRFHAKLVATSGGSRAGKGEFGAIDGEVGRIRASDGSGRQHRAVGAYRLRIYLIVAVIGKTQHHTRSRELAVEYRLVDDIAASHHGSRAIGGGAGHGKLGGRRLQGETVGTDTGRTCSCGWLDIGKQIVQIQRVVTLFQHHVELKTHAAEVDDVTTVDQRIDLAAPGYLGGVLRAAGLIATKLGTADEGQRRGVTATDVRIEGSVRRGQGQRAADRATGVV